MLSRKFTTHNSFLCHLERDLAEKWWEINSCHLDTQFEWRKIKLFPLILSFDKGNGMSLFPACTVWGRLQHKHPSIVKPIAVVMSITAWHFLCMNIHESDHYTLQISSRRLSFSWNAGQSHYVNRRKRVFRKTCAAERWLYQKVDKMRSVEFHATKGCNDKNQCSSQRHESFQVFKSSISHSQLTEHSHLGVILNRSSYRLGKCLQIRSLAKELLSNLS